MTGSLPRLALVMGLVIKLLGAWLSGRFVDPWVASLQPRLQKGLPRLLVNVAALAWVVALCALSMLAPLAVFGSEILTRIQ